VVAQTRVFNLALFNLPGKDGYIPAGEYVFDVHTVSPVDLFQKSNYD